MDEYPSCSLDYCIPLAVIFGLPSKLTQATDLDAEYKEGAILIRSELPPVEEDQATPFLQHLKAADASGLSWNGRDTGCKHKFRFRTTGSSYLLPPKLARLPEDADIPQSPAALRSPFSPLSTSSNLYPDGLIDQRWLKKHQKLIPSVFLALYSLTTDPTLATLNDNKIKTDIGVVKNALTRSGYKSKLAIVVLVDSASPSGGGVQERLDNIRKASGLDTKSFFSAPTNGSREEFGRIVDNALAILYAQAVEYYRDLGRHARKKRGRGVAPQPTVPPTSGTSQTLTLAGWNIRYDFKSAIFAEYRQEMDAALRSFEQAYEILLSPEVLEMIPSWSPRWNEGRLLADIIAVRRLRCHLWNDEYTAAVRRWQSHRDRIADLVDRRGHGTGNYGWMAWEARWAVIMANLIEKANIPDFDHSVNTVFLQPERIVLGERIQPWEQLHHPGYWYRLAARHTFARRRLAYAMPEDDRKSPSMVPASYLAAKAFTYDSYMCPEPYQEHPLAKSGVNHSELILNYLMAARSYFSKKGQNRLATELSLECAKELVMVKDWDSAVNVLRPLWDDMSYLKDGWLDIAEDVCWVLRAAAAETGQADLVVSVDWQLLNKNFTKRPNWHYDMSKSLDGIDAAKPLVKVNDEFSTSILKTSFVFRHEEGKAGQTAQAQLSVTSNAFPGSPPIVLHSIYLDFEGSIKPIVLTHEKTDGSVSSGRGRVSLNLINLTEGTPQPDPEAEGADEAETSIQLRGSSDLTLLPGQTVVFEMNIPLREPGEASASRLKLTVENDAFTLEHATSARHVSGNVWHSSGSARRVARVESHSIRVQPRPPKMQIKHLDFHDQFYTNEAIELKFDILNEEETDATAKIDVILSGEQPPNLKVRVAEEDESRALADDDECKLQAISMGTIKSSESSHITVLISPTERTSAYTLTLKVSYSLVTDPTIPVGLSASYQINVASPFEANYDLLPRLHPEPWPSLFDHEGIQIPSEGPVQPHGLSQAWCLVTRYASFAAEDLKVMDLDIEITPAHNVQCQTSKRQTLPAAGLQVSPKTIEEAQFDVMAQRVSLDDRNPMSLDVSFIIRWTRIGSDSETVNRTILPVPRLNIFGIEPRVLASVSYAKQDERLVFLDLTIENPSNHFLTFGLTMDPSDEFAFSGAKQTTLHLLPVSRRSITYRLLPLVRGAWIKPTLTVRDKYFQKILRIIPTEGMKLDKDRFLVWVPPDEDEETQ